MSSSWKLLCQLDIGAADFSFEHFLCTSAAEESEESDNMQDAEVPVPNPSQVMNAVDFLRRFAGAHKEPRTH